MREAMTRSALLSAERAEEIGLKRDRIILSAKVSAVQDLIAVYRMVARRSDYALHLGLTEAGMGSKGIVASSAALGILLQEGIGDTIRVSLTPGARRRPHAGSAGRAGNPADHGFPHLRAAGRRLPGLRPHHSTVFQELARDIQAHDPRAHAGVAKAYPGVETLNVAVMGCIVNGPGESKHADIGISLPGTGESPAAPVFIDGKKAMTLRGEGIAREFEKIVDGLCRSALRRQDGADTAAE